MRDLGVALGFQEIITYTLTDQASLASGGGPRRTHGRHRVRARGEPGGGSAHLPADIAARGRCWRRTRRTAGHHEGPLRLFEVGFEYLPVEADLPHERTVLCAVTGGPRGTASAAGSGAERIDFFDAKGDLEGLLGALGVAIDCRARRALRPASRACSGCAVRCKEQVGVIGQVHPDTAAAFDIDEPVFLLELWLEDLVRGTARAPALHAAAEVPGGASGHRPAGGRGRGRRAGAGDRSWAPVGHSAAGGGGVRRLPRRGVSQPGRSRWRSGCVTRRKTGR